MSILSNIVKSIAETNKKLVGGFLSGLTKTVVQSSTDFIDNIVDNGISSKVADVSMLEQSITEYQNTIEAYNVLMDSYKNSIEELENKVNEYEKKEYQYMKSKTVLEKVKDYLPYLMVVVGISTFLLAKRT